MVLQLFEDGEKQHKEWEAIVAGFILAAWMKKVPSQDDIPSNWVGFWANYGFSLNPDTFVASEHQGDEYLWEFSHSLNGDLQRLKNSKPAPPIRTHIENHWAPEFILIADRHAIGPKPCLRLRLLDGVQNNGWQYELLMNDGSRWNPYPGDLDYHEELKPANLQTIRDQDLGELLMGGFGGPIGPYRRGVFSAEGLPNPYTYVIDSIQQQL